MYLCIVVLRLCNLTTVEVGEVRRALHTLIYNDGTLLLQDVSGQQVVEARVSLRNRILAKSTWIGEDELCSIQLFVLMEHRYQLRALSRVALPLPLLNGQLHNLLACLHLLSMLLQICSTAVFVLLDVSSVLQTLVQTLMSGLWGPLPYGVEVLRVVNPAFLLRW